MEADAVVDGRILFDVMLGAIPLGLGMFVIGIIGADVGLAINGYKGTGIAIVKLSQDIGGPQHSAQTLASKAVVNNARITQGSRKSRCLLGFYAVQFAG